MCSRTVADEDWRAKPRNLQRVKPTQAETRLMYGYKGAMHARDVALLYVSRATATPQDFGQDDSGQDDSGRIMLQKARLAIQLGERDPVQGGGKVQSSPESDHWQQCKA